MITLDPDKCIACKLCEKVCLFGGIKLENKTPLLTDLCNGCGACVDVCREGAIVLAGEKQAPVHNTNLYSGIWVVAEQREGRVHPVTLELLGKARELADVRESTVSVVVLGNGVKGLEDLLIQHGADRVFISDAPFLADYRTIPFQRIVAELVQEHKPEIVLFGATTMGRDLAPRLANRFRTGLTADCTGLDISDEGLLLQTRPAYGGNIMATITTPNHRPQMATVRPGVMQSILSEGRKGETVLLETQKDASDDLVEIIKTNAMTQKGITMATFALCGFANFSSIAIQLGGIAPLAPDRKKDIAALGLKSVLGGGLVTLLTATLAGVLIW